MATRNRQKIYKSLIPVHEQKSSLWRMYHPFMDELYPPESDIREFNMTPFSSEIKKELIDDATKILYQQLETDDSHPGMCRQELH